MPVFQHLPYLDSQSCIPARSVESSNLPKKNSKSWNSKRMTKKETSKEEPKESKQNTLPRYTPEGPLRLCVPIGILHKLLRADFQE